MLVVPSETTTDESVFRLRIDCQEVRYVSCSALSCHVAHLAPYLKRLVTALLSDIRMLDSDSAARTSWQLVQDLISNV
jgi:hypothetical protein